MPPTCKSETLESGWTVVVSRRRKSKPTITKTLTQTKTQTLISSPWTPSDPESNPVTESKLLHKMQITINKLQRSAFYSNFLSQFQTPQISTHFSRVLGTEPKIQMVIYGIGSIESFDKSRLQLSLAISMKRDLDSIGDIEIFDPIISMVESRVMGALGCSVLDVNENGRRVVMKPTLFFMPHCEAFLYDNLLEANWCRSNLSKMVLFGNSFGQYERFFSEFRTSIAGSARYILEIRKWLVEVGIEIDGEEFMAAFHETSWNFFDVDSEFLDKVLKL